MHLNVVATDFDGTLTHTGTVEPHVWQTLQRCKQAGLKMMLVTGRILTSLRATGLDLDFFHVIIAENGAVIYLPAQKRQSLPYGTLDERLVDDIQQLGIPFMRGDAIIATTRPHDEPLLNLVMQTNVGVTLEYNRGEVMLLPAGASKGSALRNVMHTLGLSMHNLLVFGDAENDVSMFEVAELAVAPSNAAPRVRLRADVSLELPDGDGVAAFLHNFLDGNAIPRLISDDRRLRLGRTPDDRILSIDPHTLVDANLGVFGSSGSGKSWVAGFFAERLIEQGYQVFIIDPEGDYADLQRLPHTISIGRDEPTLPDPAMICTLLVHSEVNIVLDLSGTSEQTRFDYLGLLLPQLRALRDHTRRPHWLLFDEAHLFTHIHAGAVRTDIEALMAAGGVCLVSFRPGHIADELLACLQNWVVTRSDNLDDVELLEYWMARQDRRYEILDELAQLSLEKAYVSLRQPPDIIESIIDFGYSQRHVPHLRHAHKYLNERLPFHRQFHFMDTNGTDLIYSAANLWELRRALAELPAATIMHHLKRGDLERWVAGVFKDDTLSRAIQKVRNRHLSGDESREQVLNAVVQRYEELAMLM